MGVIGSEKWLNFATHPGLVAIARQLIGDDIILWGTTIFGKPARSGKETRGTRTANTIRSGRCGF